MKLFLTLLLILVVSICLVNGAGNKPPEMSQGIYCESCSAIVTELTKQLEKKTSDPHEVKVIEAIEGICDVKHFRTLQYSPPTTLKACKYLTEKYDEDIESILMKKESDPEKKICYELSKACEGVDRTKKEKEEMDVRINDRKQEVKREPDDGIQRMNVDINDPNAAKNLADQIKMQMAMGGGGAGGGDDDVDDEPDPDDDGDEGNEKSVKKPTGKTDEKTEL